MTSDRILWRFGATALALTFAASLLAPAAAPAQGATRDTARTSSVRLHGVNVSPNPAWQCRTDSLVAGGHAADAAVCDARFRVAALRAALLEHQQLGANEPCVRGVAEHIELAVGTWALGDSAAARRSELTSCDGRVLTSDSLTVDDRALLRLCPGQVWSWARRGEVDCSALSPESAAAARHYSARSQRASDLYRDQMYSRARDEALAALERDSLDANSEAVYGASLAMLGNDTTAVVSLARAVRLDPSDSWAWGMLASTLYLEHHDSAVDSVARLALAVDGDNATALQYLGLAAIRRHDTGAAVEALSRASALQPANGVLRADYARALEANGDNAAAEREARAAVRIAPNYEGAHVALASALESLGRSSDALAEYRRAHELADWDSEVNAKLAALGHP